MNKLPDFFVQYDLPADADERAIKRVYARQLKLINLETDLEGFQALRLAFEAALTWMQNQAQQTEPVPVDMQVNCDSTLAVAVPVGTLDFSNQQPVIQDAGAALADASDPTMIAGQLIADMLEDMRKHSHEHAYVDRRFLQALDDPRLIHMETSLAFELALAQYLVQGWQPGNGELFEIVSEHFGWDSDKKRLLNFGELGHILSVALLEQSEFNKNDHGVRSRYWSLLLKARYEREPGHEYLTDYLPTISRIHEMYPVWTMMVSSRENIKAWYASHEAAQREAVSAQETVSANAAINKKESPYLRFMFFLYVLFCLFIVFSIAMMIKREPLHTAHHNQEDTRLSVIELMKAGDGYFSGKGSYTRDVNEAIYYWGLASNKGSGEASYQLAWIFDPANGVNANLMRALEMYAKAADQGHLKSQLMMGNYYASGDAANISKALYFYELAARQGNHEAQLKLARLYEKAQGILDSEKKSVDWLQAAADGKEPGAESSLADLYLHGGRGIRKDEEKAYYWAARSAAQNDPAGLSLLAQIYEQGLAQQAVDLDRASKLYAAASDTVKFARERLAVICKTTKYAGCRA
ncbi:tetratricopeptide repeat protein [Undibacterium sp. TC4M20W]|uniref:tetratricopeptide repeat protein n=1 Tax=Undibacterium sp. TC4M20W TaxID=3413052 RepID=UPI003BF26E0B